MPAPLREQLDGVREGGGDDRPAARDGVDQDTGGDLVGRVVGQDDDGSDDWTSAVSVDTSR